MNSRSPRFEKITYLFAFLLAIGLRFARLGELPLTDSEARLALDALSIVKGQAPVLTSHVAYTNLTAILFFLFGSFNFLARFVPALSGSALVLVPFLLRDPLKPRAALLLAIFLAIDPALVALSRQAGSPILAVTFSLLAAAFWVRRQPRSTGIFLALALLSGPALWPGLLGLLLTWMLTQFMAERPREEGGTQGNTKTRTQEDSNAGMQEAISRDAQHTPLITITDFRSLITVFAATLILVSTLFFLAPQGLGAWLASLPVYFAGWGASVTIPASRLLLALGVYQLFGVLLAILAIVRGWVTISRRVIRLSLWALAALLLAIFYPAHQTSDLIWTTLPLYTLAALELSRHLQLAREEALETAGVAVFTVILLAFAWLDFIALYWTPVPSSQGTIRLLLLIGTLVLLVLSAVLIGFGWSTQAARVGLAWGASLIFGIYTFGAAWGAAGLRSVNAVELWDSSPRLAQADLLSQTADQTSEWATGHADTLPVTVYGVDSPALLWALRNHNPKVVTALDLSSSPELVIAPAQNDIALAVAYRGQDFAWRQTPSWEMLPAYSVRWLTYRELPATSENIVLWVRADLFVEARPSEP